MDKKRDLLPLLNDCIIALSNMSKDVAKLELMDNEVASRKINRDILAFKGTELDIFTKAMRQTREEVRKRPKRQISAAHYNNLINNLSKTNKNNDK